MWEMGQMGVRRSFEGNRQVLFLFGFFPKIIDAPGSRRHRL